MREVERRRQVGDSGRGNKERMIEVQERYNNKDDLSWLS